MKVTLVYPRFRTALAGGLEEPLGILYVASALRGAGHDVRFVDLTFDRSLDVLDDALPGSDWVGMSSSSALFGTAGGVLGYVKRVAPGVPTVIGGPHATVATEDALNAGFDYALLGEAEDTVREFSELLGRGRTRECPGMAWSENGRVRVNDRPGFVSDLDALPLPARLLRLQGRYRRLFRALYRPGQRLPLHPKRLADIRQRLLSLPRHLHHPVPFLARHLLPVHRFPSARSFRCRPPRKACPCG